MKCKCLTSMQINYINVSNAPLPSAPLPFCEPAHTVPPSFETAWRRSGSCSPVSPGSKTDQAGRRSSQIPGNTLLRSLQAWPLPLLDHHRCVHCHNPTSFYYKNHHLFLLYCCCDLCCEPQVCAFIVKYIYAELFSHLLKHFLHVLAQNSIAFEDLLFINNKTCGIASHTMVIKVIWLMCVVLLYRKTCCLVRKCVMPVW